MRLKKRFFRVVGVTLVAIVPLVAVACGNDKGSTSNETSGGSSCFTQMTPDQKSQLTDYVNQQGGQIQNAGNNADGTQDICVLEDDGRGGYNQKYYRQDDHFNDYLMYSMLMGNSNALLSYGLISGDLDLGEAMALSLLTGVNSRGGMYHPYQYTDAGWGYRPTVVNKTKITNVYYGNGSQPQSFGKPAPKGYAPTRTLPTKAPDAMAGAHIGANGKGEIGKTGDKGASSTLKDAKVSPVTLPAAKQVAPAVSVPVPAVVTPAKPVPVTQAPATPKPPQTQVSKQPVVTPPKVPTPAPAKPAPAPQKPAPRPATR